MDKEKAEAYRVYFEQQLLAHQEQLSEYWEQSEKIDRRIDIEMERFLNMLRPPGTGRN